MSQRWSSSGNSSGGGGAGGGGGLNVAQWLAQKTSGGASPAPPETETRGAIAWLASQTQQGKLSASGGVKMSSPDPESRPADKSPAVAIPQPRSTVGRPQGESAAPQSGTGVPAPRSQQNASAGPKVDPAVVASQAQTGVPIAISAAAPLMGHGAPIAIHPYPLSVGGVQVVHPVVYVPVMQVQAEALMGGQGAAQVQPHSPPQNQNQAHRGPSNKDQQSRKNRRDQNAAGSGRLSRAERESQLQQQQEALRAQDEALRLQQEQLEKDPAYREWYEQQKALAQQGDTVRMRVFQHLQEQDSLAQVESQQANLQREKLNLAGVLQLIAEHDVTIVCTDTGTGKSSLIPTALLDTVGSSARIACTQPRRTATIALAEHVTRQRHESVGEDIGYWIRGDKRGSDDHTRLWYMTSYTLLLHLLKDPLNPPFTHILLDEFHERQPDLEVTAAILKLCLKHRTAGFKLVLMSATLNSEDWENYFEPLAVAVYKQSEPEHPIHDFFLADACALTGCSYARQTVFSPIIADGSVIDNNMFIAQQLVSFLNAIAQPHHAVLVFVPGRAQVDQFVMWAQNNLRGRVDPIAWHSGVDLSQIQAAIARRGQRAQKVYIATDIAEVSITLPDVVFVIDLGLVKRPHISASQPATILYPPLTTQWVSKVNIAQRRGRVGRVQQGFYFCLVAAETIPQLANYPPSPIQHSRIDELALHSLQVVSNPIALFGLCRGQPQLETIGVTMRTLTSLGCILRETDPFAEPESIREVHDNERWSEFIMRDASALVGADIEGYRTTFIGRLMQLIPVSTQQGMLVFYGFLTGLESLMILAAAVTNSVSPFDVRIAGRDSKAPRGRGRGGYESAARAMEQTESTMKETALNLSSDVVAIMGAILRCQVQCRGHENDPEFVRMWCEDRNMSYDRTMAIIELNAHIKFELAGFVPFRDIDDPQVLTTQLTNCAPIVVAACCGAFAAQALEVTVEGNFQSSSKETAVGLFTDLKGMPDLHSPSCIRWELGDIIVPVAVNLRFSHMLVSFATAVKTSKEFYLSLLLFAYRLRYGAFADDQGTYYEFSVTYSNTTRYIETDSETGGGIVEYRGLCTKLCQSMRLQYSHKDLTEEQFNETVLAPRGLPPLAVQQKSVTSLLVNTFFGAPHAKMDVVEVQHGGEELDHETLFAFAL